MPSGESSVANPALPPSPVPPEVPFVPAIVETTFAPPVAILRIVWSPVSATKRLPELSTTKSLGDLNLADRDQDQDQAERGRAPARRRVLGRHFELAPALGLHPFPRSACGPAISRTARRHRGIGALRDRLKRFVARRPCVTPGSGAGRGA